MHVVAHGSVGTVGIEVVVNKPAKEALSEGANEYGNTNNLEKVEGRNEPMKK